MATTMTSTSTSTTATTVLVAETETPTPKPTLAKMKTKTKPIVRRKRKKPLMDPPYHLFRNHDANQTNTTTANANANDFLEGVANLLEGRKNIVVLVGAGISTSVGIPDFRSKDKGLYNTLDAEELGLSCPEDLFCIDFFSSNPLPFYKFAKHLYYPNQEQDERKSGNATTNTTTTTTNRKETIQTKASPPPPAAKSTRTSQRVRSRRRRPREEDESLPEPSNDSPPPTTSGVSTKAAATATITTTSTIAPSDSHKLLALLEKRKMLLRVYTQNIDGLESSAGVSDSRIVYCHGSLRSMSCTKCSRKNLPLDESILASIQQGSVPFCRAVLAKKTTSTKKQREIGSPSSFADPSLPLTPTRTSKRTKRPRRVMEGCDDDNGFGHHHHNITTADGQPCCGGVLKPGITFFGETLNNSVGRKIESDKSKADALIVIGTSLSVAPISKVIEYLPKNIPRILINRTIVHPKSVAPTVEGDNRRNGDDNDDDDYGADHDYEFRKNYVFDAYLLGFCDDVTRALGKQLGVGFSIEKTKTPKTKDGGTKSKAKPKPKSVSSEPVVGEGHASATGAKLLNSDDIAQKPCDDGWREITVPRGRVLLFPGALPVVGQDAAEAAAQSYQEIAHCDGCSKQIPFGRHIFKCDSCFDYDLCQTCYPKVSKLHCNGKHSFRRE